MNSKELREAITQKAYSADLNKENAEWLADKIMVLISENCWLKTDDKENKVFQNNPLFIAYVHSIEADNGWVKPVKPIGVNDED